MGRVGIMPAQRVARGLNPLLTFHSVAWGMCFHPASGKNIFKFPLCWRELEPALCPSPICPYTFTHFQFESVPENIKYQYLSSGECYASSQRALRGQDLMAKYQIVGPDTTGFRSAYSYVMMSMALQLVVSACGKECLKLCLKETVPPSCTIHSLNSANERVSVRLFDEKFH